MVAPGVSRMTGRMGCGGALWDWPSGSAGPSDTGAGPHSWTAAILSEAVGRLTAGVAHDFNNPLMSIGCSGRVDRDAAFLRSGVRPVPMMQSTGVTIRAVTQSCYPICDRYSTCCLPQRDHDPTIYVGR